MRRGLLIAIEGIDGVGKTTQVRRVCESLGKENCYALRFPTREGETGSIINEALKGSISLEKPDLYELFVSNKIEYVTPICEQLQAGVNVIIDRYYHSGVAYGVGAMEMDLDYCINSERVLPPVDLLIYLDPGDDLISADCKELWEVPKIQRSVKGVYENILANYRERLPYAKLVTIDAKRPVEAVTSLILGALSQM